MFFLRQSRFVILRAKLSAGENVSRRKRRKRKKKKKKKKRRRRR